MADFASGFQLTSGQSLDDKMSATLPWQVCLGRLLHMPRFPHHFLASHSLKYGLLEPPPRLGLEIRAFSRSSGREVRIGVPFFSVVYFMGTLPQKRNGKRALYRDRVLLFDYPSVDLNPGVVHSPQKEKPWVSVNLGIVKKWSAVPGHLQDT